MKKQSNVLFATVKKANIKSLTEIVQETLATDLGNQAKVFTVADLWNIKGSVKVGLKEDFYINQ